MTTPARTTLQHLCNLPPKDLRELIYSNTSTFSRRSHMKGKYRTRGELVTECFELWEAGKLRIPTP